MKLNETNITKSTKHTNQFNRKSNQNEDIKMNISENNISLNTILFKNKFKKLVSQEDNLKAKFMTITGKNQVKNKRVNKDNRSFSTFSKIKGFDMKSDLNYRRDDYITYNNCYFNKYSNRNYNGYVEIEMRCNSNNSRALSEKRYEKRNFNNSFYRIFPDSNNSNCNNESCGGYGFRSIKNIRIVKPKPETFSLLNHSPYSNKINSQKVRKLYGNGQSSLIIGSNDLFLNVNKDYIPLMRSKNNEKDNKTRIKIINIEKIDRKENKSFRSLSNNLKEKRKESKVGVNDLIRNYQYSFKENNEDNSKKLRKDYITEKPNLISYKKVVFQKYLNI